MAHPSSFGRKREPNAAWRTVRSARQPSQWGPEGGGGWPCPEGPARRIHAR